MFLNFICFILLFLKYLLFATSAPIPLELQEHEQTARLKFHLNLSNNKTIEIKLSFKLMTPSEVLPIYNKQIANNNSSTTNLTTLTSSTTTTTDLTQYDSDEITLTTSTPSTTTTTDSTDETTLTILSSDTETMRRSISSEVEKLVTVDEAIESFRQTLIKKELEIAGIIESKEPFYRHFKLEFPNNVEIPIRCTYDSDFLNKRLSITCYEFREIGEDRLLSNGEFETSSYLYTPEFLSMMDMKQTYSMTIV